MAFWDDVKELPKWGFDKVSTYASDTFNNIVPSASQKITEIADKVNLEGFQGQLKNILFGVPKSKIFGNTETGSFTDLTYNDNSLSLSEYNSPNEQLWVKLQSSINNNDFMIFNVMPTVSESRDANYEEVRPVQHPGAMLKYTGTNSRQWSISNIRFVSRTEKEATENLYKLNLIRSWVMPYYGAGTAAAPGGMSMLGAPPDVLYFSAYGTRNIEKTPVVLISYSFDYPNDITYIGCAGDPTLGIKQGTPFPIIMTLTLTIKEAYSAQEYSNFDIFQYKQGNMSGAYNGNLNTTSISESQDTPKKALEEINSPVQLPPVAKAVKTNNAVKQAVAKATSQIEKNKVIPTEIAGKAVGIAKNGVPPVKWYDHATGKELDVLMFDQVSRKVYTRDNKIYQYPEGWIFEPKGK